MNKKIIIALLIVAAVMGMSSCDLIGGIFNPYMGTWERATDNSRMTMILEKEAWEMKSEVKIQEKWYLMADLKGTMVVENDTVTMTTTHTKNGDETTGVIADTAEWVAVTPAVVGDPITWAIDGDKLTLTYKDGSKLELTEVK